MPTTTQIVVLPGAIERNVTTVIFTTMAALHRVVPMAIIANTVAMLAVPLRTVSVPVE